MEFISPASDRQALFNRSGTLLVTRPAALPPRPASGQPGIPSSYLQGHPDIFVAVLDDGRVQAFNGHVDLGTGIRTALAQVVADELGVGFERVTMILGHTEATPNQGPTIASASLQISAVPLRQSAALARQYFIEAAARALSVAPDSLSADDGWLRSPDGRALSYWQLLAGRQVRLEFSTDVRLKDSCQFSIIGKPVPRVDIPAKATGGLTFVHDVRVPGMWHARVVRPPYTGRDGGSFVGTSLLHVDKASVAKVAADIRVVVIGDFVAVAARQEHHAIKAAKMLKVQWREPPALEPLDDLDAALRRQPSTERVLLEAADAPDRQAATSLQRTYVWPYQMHASVGPSCAVAQYTESQVTVWAGTQNPHMLRAELARLLSRLEGDINIVRYEASGCYGRNCADDVCADAVLVSREIGYPVRVQLTRAQEHGWEPKGAAQVIDVAGSLDDQQRLLSYDFVTRYPSNDAPSLALLLTGVTSNVPRVLEMGDRTAVPPYAYPNRRISCLDMAPIVRAGWLRGVSAMPNSFAHDVFIDELADAAGQDPVAFRLRNLPDERAAKLLRETAARASWVAGQKGSRGVPDDDGELHGRGVAYARYVHSKFPGFGAAWSVWVIDVAVNPVNGRIRIKRVVVGQDTGMVVNPDGVRHQIEGNVIQSLSRVLKECVVFNDKGVVDQEWGAYPILPFTEVPPIDVFLLLRQDQPPMGSGESASVPSAAAVSNALFDATGHRLREVPFTPERVRAGCAQGVTVQALAGLAGARRHQL